MTFTEPRRGFLSFTEQKGKEEEEEWASSSDEEDNDNILPFQSLTKEHVKTLSMPPASTRSNYSSVVSSAEGTYTSGASASTTSNYNMGRLRYAFRPRRYFMKPKSRLGTLSTSITTKNLLSGTNKQAIPKRHAAKMGTVGRSGSGGHTSCHNRDFHGLAQWRQGRRYI